MAQSIGWQPGPGAAAGSTYQGNVDSPTRGAIILTTGSFLVRGWFVDTSAQGWAGVDNVQVWLGAMDGGGQMLAQAQFDQPRPDVGSAMGNPYWANSGFLAAVPGASMPGGPQTLYIYVHTPGNGWWYQTVQVNGGGTASNISAGNAAPTGLPQVQVIAPIEGQNISQLSRQSTISGTVSDASNTTVDVWLDGDRNSPGAIELGTATPSTDGSWQLVMTPNHIATGHHNLSVYADDRSTALETEIIAGFNIVNQ